MHIKKILAFIICLAIFSTVTAFGFSDTRGHWAEGYALALNTAGIFNGDEAGRANLTGNIKRSEFIALLTRSLYNDMKIDASEKGFNDVTADKWYFEVVTFAKSAGIVNGSEDGNFYPDRSITREEIVLMLYRALKLEDGESSFDDVPADYAWYNEISAAVEREIINGYEDNTFRPKANATRGEAAAMLCRMLGVQPEQAPTAEKKINLTWHQMYSAGVGSTGSYTMDGVTVISPMWFRVIDNTGKIPAAYEYMLDDLPNYYLQSYGNSDYMKDAKSKGYEVWPLLKGDGTTAGQSRFLNNEKARKSAVDTLSRLAKLYGFTGINMDFENMNVSDKDMYTQFVKEMSEMCAKEGLVLSVDVTKYNVTGGTWSLCYDRAAIAKYADYVAVMAYDEYGTWSKKGGSVASLPWVEECITVTLKEVPAQKLLLGIPFYTRLWREENGTVVKTSAIGMDTAMKQINDAGATLEYDKISGQNYAQWDDGSQTCKIWLEDETSVAARIDLMKKYDLAGIASWSKTFERQSIWQYIEGLLN